jgi:hypothetical protein
MAGGIFSSLLGLCESASWRQSGRIPDKELGLDHKLVPGTYGIATFLNQGAEGQPADSVARDVKGGEGRGQII